MNSRLEVVRAGAGSGKTTDLCTTVASAVADGLDPARLLATTFTKKAAAELKGRIQAALLERSSCDVAAARYSAGRLELAAVGTVHGVAHQLIRRYAIQLGLSPRLKVLVEGVGARALEDLLEMVEPDAWEALAGVAERLSVTGPRLQSLMLNLLAAKRGNRIADDTFRLQMAAGADRVCALLAPQGALSGAPQIDGLYELVSQALARIETVTNDTTQATQNARQALRQMRAQQSPAWRNYVLAGKIAAGKRSGANQHLEALRSHGATVRRQPGLHADLKQLSGLLAEQVVALEARYNGYKAERGLVDFTDLEILFLALLENADLNDVLRRDFDLVLVDEFQDTNPLQLAIFERLRQLSRRSRWVGDPKQAIYGFRDTDPQLVNEVWRNAPDATRTELPKNYRSQKKLVQLTGKLFEPIFGSEAVQQPARQPLPRGIERWEFASRNQSDDVTSLGCGIAALRTEGVRYGDIAVLERSNRQLAALADSFDDLGIPYLLESPGLLSTREGALVLAGLRLVADRKDSLAASHVLHILGDPGKETPDWLAERLTAVRASEAAREADAEAPKPFAVPWQGDARFAAIERIGREAAPPSVIVLQVIEALDVPTLLSSWGDAARRSSHLDSLLLHASEYEETAIEAGAAATLTGLILHLEALSAAGDDVRHPPLGHDAVTLTTYHSAKGLKWPVVVLSGLNAERDPDMWSPVVTGGDPVHDHPLAGRVVRYWPWPFGFTDGEFPKQVSGTGLQDDALQSPEGQERMRVAQEETLRLLYVGATRAKDKLVLAHRAGKYAWLGQLPDVDTILDCSRGEGEHDLEEIETTFVIRRFDATMVDACRQELPGRETWLSSGRVPDPPPPTDRYHRPSETGALAVAADFSVENLQGPSFFPPAANEEDFTAIGNAVHAYLAALPSMGSLPAEKRAGIASRCIAAYSVGGFILPDDLVCSGDRFTAWIQARYPGAAWHTETLVSSPRKDGGQWTGTVDLLLQLPDGDVVVIDHKSAPIRREQCAKKAATYAGQLQSYQEILQTQGIRVRSTWVHFPLAGVMAEMLAATA